MSVKNKPTHHSTKDEAAQVEEKNLQLERLVFFSDAVVAIAITLLALDIKIEPTSSGHLSFSDILGEWKVFAAFLLSFVNIANFWKTHHMFFAHIKQIDERLLGYNVAWLFFIVTLPFSTSLVSSYFFDTPAIFLYSLNTLLIACCQNLIWDYVSDNHWFSSNRINRHDFLKEDSISESMISQYRLFCNLDMINALLAVGLSFLSPAFAFISLFTKLPLIVVARMVYRTRDQRGSLERPGATNRGPNGRR
ncbi:TMEM175 family protein [Spirosoma koreense]